MTRGALVVAVALALLATSQSLAATTLRITIQLPLSSPLGKNLIYFKDRVEQASPGGFDIQLYPSAQLFADKEVPAAVASGQIEMGVASLSRFAGTIPAVDVFSVPFLLHDEALVRAATAPGSPVRAPLDKAMTDKGARPLWWQPYGLSVLATSGTLVRQPADLAGMKIRTYGKALEQFVNLVGGAAANVSGEQQYLAYERGTVDGGLTGILSVQERKLYQVLDKLTLLHHSDIEFIVLINERLWQSLGAAEQTVLSEAARAAEIALRDEFAALEQAALAEAEANGMEVYHLNDADVAAWRAATAPLSASFIDAAGPLGAELVAAAESLGGAR